MKTLLVDGKVLRREGRWDIDYHLPPTEIESFPEALVVTVRDVAEVVKMKRDPTRTPDRVFQYVDIASVDVEAGIIARPQELTGVEAPSRARKVVSGYDLIVSTCRPTRGAIAIVPENLHDQICSTAFSVLRAKEGVNPLYLWFVLRLPSTLEQFRKWSTGSSYPAILDEDVLKTRIPVLPDNEQDEVACRAKAALTTLQQAMRAANSDWETSVAEMTGFLQRKGALANLDRATQSGCTIAEIAERLVDLGPVSDGSTVEEDEESPSLFDEEDDSEE